VHYTVEGEEQAAVEIDRIDEHGLRVMEGVVTRVDREGKKLSIRLANGSIETLRLSERAAGNVDKNVDRAVDDSARVIVYYTDEAGNRVVHYFKRIS
jgi:hypothetical protein